MLPWDTEYENRFLETPEVLKLIDKAIEQKKGISLARFGIGEITYLSYETSPILVENFQRYEQYAGVTLSKEEVRARLNGALKATSLAGLISQKKLPFWAERTKQVLMGLSFSPEKVCSAWVMHDLVRRENLWSWLEGKKVVLVGRRSLEAVPVFQENGIEIIKAMNLEGFHEIDNVKSKMHHMEEEWDVVLISAGIPATVLAPEVAKLTGKVAIDFGHALDMLLDGNDYKHSKLVERWMDERNEK
ncbi:GT-D fold domain-containing glycosyltransferase [Pseudalkalibacillus caeni]|uniref:DUF1792 domain-containing protein n=1 Tax=Exobacillus caeni TaxID=2574798 RepID=A0A5R9FCU1_9BACL|nr:GT-D fold domain-containing glycosyltransferase [Pseudalkalibacillus caeni]TLS37465.1 DUF1792 domain-containing protein [Pseudalkalibacillus caeni]